MSNPAKALLDKLGHTVELRLGGYQVALLAELLPALFEGSSVGVEVDRTARVVRLWRKDKQVPYDG